MGRRCRPDELDFLTPPDSGFTQAARAAGAWSRATVRGIEDLRDAVLGAGLEAVQMSSGTVTGSLVFADLGGILYGSGSIDGAVSLVGPLSEKRVTVGIGLAFPGGCRHWHEDVATGGVGIFLAGGAHDARYRPGARYATATLSLERLEAEAARQDLVLDARALGGTRIHPRTADPRTVAWLDRRMGAVHAGNHDDRDLGPDLLAAIVAHCAREPWARAASPRPSGHRRIVERARAFIAAHLDEPLSIDAVAAAAGTSRRTLFRIFVALLEETPTLYVRRLQLHRIRQDLASPEEAATSIAVLAGKWGIGEHGRFAGWYRELFGETPSRTRAALHRRASPGAAPSLWHDPHGSSPPPQ